MSPTDSHAQKLTLVFVINGQEVSEIVNVHAPLVTAVHKALTDTGNTGRPFDEWETRDASGALVETNRKVSELQLANGTRLFVSLKVGAGGTCV
jgi:Protein of Unknown function (DUF2604)